MNQVLKVNRLFLQRGDAWKVATALALMLFRGKTVSLVSEAAKLRLSSFTSDSKPQFAKSLLVYVFALVAVSPLNLVLNELLRMLRLQWSNRLTRVLAKQMLFRKANNGSINKDFETIVSNDADKFVELEIDLAREVLEATSHLYFFTLILWAQSPLLAKCAMGTAVVTTAVSLQFGATRLSQLFQREREHEAIFSHTLSTIRENLESIQFANAAQFELDRISKLDLLRQEASMVRKREKDVVSVLCHLLRQTTSAGLPAWILRSKEEEEECHDPSHHHGHAHHGKLHHNATHAGHSHASAVHSHGDHDHDHHGDNKTAANQIAILVQTTEAFDEMLFHLLIVTENFHSVVRMLAIAEDISNLVDEVDLPHDEHEWTTPKDANWLLVESLSIHAPNQPDKILLTDCTFSLARGESLLITGPSGCGKTSMLRVLFGLWPSTTATRIVRPERMVCVAQKPYLCLGTTLKQQACFPASADEFTDEQVLLALGQVGLGQFSPQLNNVEKCNWQMELSMGEQQRIAFARILLHKYEYVFLDESTSSCDLATEAKLYSLLQANNVCFVSVGHRQSIEQFHHHKLVLLGGQEGKWKITGF